jgi:hypothetical protein
MDSPTFIMSHVVISAIAIVSGIAVIYGLVAANQVSRWTLLFLVTSTATSVTGFFFHRDHLLPSHIVGSVALGVLALTCMALYGFRLRNIWRAVYIVGAVLSLWFNVFVLIAQAFLKVPSLHVLAPLGSEPPFAIAQCIALVVFIFLGVRASRRFHPEY